MVYTSEIGDAIATHLEAQSSRKNASPWKGLTAEVASVIGDKCQETLFKYGKLAYEANKAHAVTPAFEAVVEANTLLSRLSFESGGVAAAHSVWICTVSLFPTPDHVTRSTMDYR